MKRVILLLAVAVAVACAYLLIPDDATGRRSGRGDAARAGGGDATAGRKVGSPARGTCALAIVVVAEDGAPAGGATVAVRDPGGGDTGRVADADGRVALAGVAAGPYAVRAALDGAVGAAECALRAGRTECVVRLRAALELRGRVLDAEGSAIAGACVEALRGSDDRDEQALQDFFRRAASPDPLADAARTDDAGAYLLRLPGPGTYAVRAWTPAHGQESRGARRYERGEDGVDFHLSAAVAIEGRVVDANGRPVPGARVALLDPYRMFGGRHPKVEAFVDADGRFALPMSPAAANPEHAELILCARAPGYAARIRDWIEAPARDVEIVLERGVTIVLRAVDAADPAVPVGDLVAEAWSGSSLATGRGDAAGRLVLAHVGLADSDDATDREIRLRSDRFVNRTIDFSGHEVKDGVVDLGVVTMERGGIVRGVVIGAVTERPVAGARVYALGGPSMKYEMNVESPARTDAEGRYELRGVDLRAEALYVSHPDYPCETSRLLAVLHNSGGPAAGGGVFPSGATEVVRDYRLQPGGELRGTVRSASGEPVAGATVVPTVGNEDDTLPVLGFGPHTVFTDAEGRFVVRPLAPGVPVRLQASHPAHGPAPTTVAKAGAEVSLVLTAPILVVGVVRDEEDNPVAGTWITLARTPGDDDEEFFDDFWSSAVTGASGTARTDARGRFAIRNAPPDARELYFEHAEFRPLGRDISLAGRSRLDLGVVRLERGPSIAGIVVGPNGKPAPRVVVWAAHPESMAELSEEPEEPGAEPEPPGRTDASTRTDDEGRFRLAGLADGTFEIRVEREGWHCDPLPVEAGAQDVRIEMRKAAELRGRVLCNGRPVAGADVTGAFVEGDEEEYFAWVETDEEGRFRLGSIPPGRRFRLEIASESHRRLVVPDAGASEEERVYTLDEGRVVEGVVVDEGGRGVPRLRVLVRPGEGHDETDFTAIRHCVTDANGRFRAGGCTTGPLDVEIHSDDGEWIQAAPVPVAAGAIRARVVVARAWSVSGTVTAPAGVRLESISVVAIDAGGEPVVDADCEPGTGAFTLRGLPKGTYTLHAQAESADGGDPGWIAERAGVPAGATGVRLELRRP